jgi:hypothetical protein
MTTKDDAPLYPGVLNLVGLAEELGISRQAVHQAAETGRIHTLRRIRGGDRPVWVLDEAEIPELRCRLVDRVLAARRTTDHDDNGSEAPGAPAREVSRQEPCDT